MVLFLLVFGLSHGFDGLHRVTQMFAGLESLLQLSNFVDEGFLLVYTHVRREPECLDLPLTHLGAKEQQ